MTKKELVAEAHEIFTLAQLLPNEGMVDAVDRIVEKLETLVQQPLSGSADATPKLPSLEDVKDRFIGSIINTKDVEKVYFVIKKLGNFAQSENTPRGKVKE